MNEIRTAVVGVGYLGRFHAQKYASTPGSRLVAVVDSEAPRRAAVAAELGVEPLADYRDLVGSVEAVSIAVPPRLHHQIAGDMLRAGIHVLVEKPIAVTAREAAELNELAAERHLVLQVGHLERFNAAILGVAPLLEAPLFIESHRLAPYKERSADVNVVFDLMIHDIDLILDIVKSPIAGIDANGAAVISGEPDIANARISFASGCVANVTASRVTLRVERKLRIFQKDAYVSIDLHHRRASVYRRGGQGIPTPLPGITLEEHAYPEGDALREEIKAFLASIRTGQPPPVTGEDGKRALETAIEIANLVGAGAEVRDRAIGLS